MKRRFQGQPNDARVLRPHGCCSPAVTKKAAAENDVYEQAVLALRHAGFLDETFHSARVEARIAPTAVEDRPTDVLIKIGARTQVRTY